MTVQNPSPHREAVVQSAPTASRGRFTELVRLVRHPIGRFLRIEAASGIVLLVAAAGALVWANLDASGGYARFWGAPHGFRFGALAFERSLEWLVNDVLMTLFFFVAGMEIRREAHEGALSSWRGAALPLVAAVGGMLAPAGLYLLTAGEPPTRSGWGIPMATDIAFAIGVLALLGKRVPTSLRVLLLTLAVLDDLGAILVIAIFYSGRLDPSGGAIAVTGFGAIALMRRLRFRAKLPYLAAAVVAWVGVHTAGVHSAIAGVGLGLMAPVKGTTAADHEGRTPSRDLIESLHPWVAYGVMPSFALANAGVVVSPGALESCSLRVAIGVAVGLVLGKPAGILVASLLALRLRVATLPAGIGLRHLLVLGTVAGVGFTMAIFTARLAFVSPPLLDAAKIGVLVASASSAVLGLVLGGALLTRRPLGKRV